MLKIPTGRSKGSNYKTRPRAESNLNPHVSDLVKLGRSTLVMKDKNQKKQLEEMMISDRKEQKIITV